MTDNPEEPLIANVQSTEGDQHDGSHDVEHAHESRGGKQHISPPGLFIWLLTFSAGISGLLFGCTLPYNKNSNLHLPYVVPFPF